MPTNNHLNPFLSIFLLLLLLISFPISATPIKSVSSEVFDDDGFEPGTGTLNSEGTRYEIWDGDFYIFLPKILPDGTDAKDEILGDGSRENWAWYFNFTSDANWDDFSNINQILGANLTLTLKAATDVDFQWVLDDGLSVFFPGHDIARPEDEIKSLEGQDDPITITIDLLKYYTPEDMLYASLGLSVPGRFGMGWSNNVSIDYAELTLEGTEVPVPAPPSLALMGLGLLGLSISRKRKRAKLAS